MTKLNESINRKSVNENRSKMKDTNNTKRTLSEEIEDILDKSTAIANVQAIMDKLQSMAEDLGTIQTKMIMPLLDTLTTAYGPELAQQFNQVGTEQTSALIAAVQTAKTTFDGQILRMKKGIEGGDISDLGMMGSEPPVGDPMADDGHMDGEPGPEANLPEAPPDMGGMEDAEIGGADNFAGRAKKEGAKRRGTMLEAEVTEDFLGSDVLSPKTITPPGEHKGPHFDGNLDNAKEFHGGAGKLAHEVAGMIRSEPLSGQERRALSNVLSHFCAFCHDPSHWGIDTETKLTSSLKANDLYDHGSKPAVAKIVDKLRELVGTISHAHKSMTESAIRDLRKSSDPDAMILGTFRKKLSETRDPQLAAIRTARTFAIDVDDVVSIIREAAKKAKECAACKGTGKVKGKKCFKCDGTGEMKKPVKEAKKKEQTEDGRGKFKVTYTNPDKKNVGNDRFETEAEAKKYAAGLRKDGYHDVSLGEARQPVKEAWKHGYDEKTDSWYHKGIGVDKKKFEQLDKADKAQEADKKKPVKEFKMNTPNSAKGMFKGKSEASVKKEITADKGKIAAANKDGKGHAAASEDLKRAEFDIRAKKSSNGGGWHKKVNEEELLQNVPVFPVGAKSATDHTGASSEFGNFSMNDQPQRSTPPVGGQSNNPSTNKTQSPGEMRFRQAQAKSAAQSQPKMTDDGKNQTMVTPLEKDDGDTVPRQQRGAPMPVKDVPRKRDNRDPQAPEMPGRIAR